MKRFLKVFSYCTGFTFLNIIMQFVAIIPILIIVIFEYVLKSGSVGDFSNLLTGNMDDIIVKSTIPILLLAGALTFLTAWLIHVIAKKSFFDRLYFNKAKLSQVLVGFLFGIALSVLFSFIIGLIQQSGIATNEFTKFEELMDPIISGQNIYMLAISIGILLPFLEELIFRGLIINQLNKHMKRSLVVLIQAFLFGIAHLNLIQSSYAFLYGIIIGLTLYWSNSIWVPTAIHIGNNLFNVILVKLQSHITYEVSGLIYLFTIIMLPLGMYILFKDRKKETLQY